MRYRFLLANPYTVCYEGEGEGGEAAGAGGGEGGAAGAGGTPPPNTEKKTFTQDEVNEFLAKDRKVHRGQVDKTVKELETLKRSKALTEEEKSNLQKRIDDLQNSILTKEELAKKEREKLENTHKSTVQQLTTERDTWQTRFISSTINVAITGEAVKAEAFDNDDLIARLGPNTRLVEDVDDDGKGTGHFTPKVKFNDVDADGKSVTLDLTVDQAIKRMKEMPRYAHLFKSTATGGLGASAGSGGKAGAVDISKMTPEQYRKHRKDLNLSRKVGQN